MIKLGDKLRFSEYIPKNYMNGSYLKTSLSGNRLFTRVSGIMRSENEVSYITTIVKDNVFEGTYVGTFRKKLKRTYRKTPGYDIRNIPRDLIQYDRVSTNPRRMDNPRQLTKIYMINYRGKLLGVPMRNIYMCNHQNLIKVL